MISKSSHPLSLIVLSLALSLLLSGCSQFSSRLPADTQAPRPLTANSLIQQWQLSGKIGLRNGSQGTSAYINWRQCKDDFTIRLTGPLGQGAALLSGNSSSAHLTTSEQQHFYASSAEQLLQQQFGWSIPVAQLLYWLRGIPAPDQSFISDDQSSGFLQNQWQLNYPTFSFVEGYQLPEKAIAINTPLKVTLIIKDWQLHPDCESAP